jgi:hypothetical protein
MSGISAASAPHRTAAAPDFADAVHQPPARKPKGKGGIGTTVILAVGAIIWISPLALLVVTSLRPLSDFIGTGPLAWPRNFTWDNFSEAWRVGNFTNTYRNSAILLALKVPIGVMLSAMLAYALAKLRIRFRRTIMFGVFLGLTIPIYITIVPVFIMLRGMGVTDSLLGLVGPYLAFGIPFEVLVLQSFFRQLPDELIEAAKIDGAGEWRIFLDPHPAAVATGSRHRRDPRRRRDVERVPVRPHRPQLRRQPDDPGRAAQLPGAVRQQQHGSGRRHPHRRRADPARLRRAAALDCRRPHRRRYQGVTRPTHTRMESDHE